VGRKTNKQRREQGAATAREKAAAARAIQQRAEQRRRASVILSVVVVVALVVAIGVVVGIHAHSSSGGNNDRTASGTQHLVQTIGSVSPAALQQVGAGSTSQIAKPTSGDPPLTKDGKPEFLYVGGEFCPFCAAERWSMIQALSRFGTFSGVSQIHSGVNDGNIATFTFYKSHYTSKYISFVPVENEDRDQKPLQALTASQTKIFKKYTTGFPFLDLGGKFVQTNAGYDPTDLTGLSQQQIAAQLKTPTGKVAQDILGEANRLTSMLCTLTKNQPANVCLSPVITNLQAQIGA
jgi:hypothetical protein